MTAAEIVDRARSAVGKGTQYKLGKGGRRPLAAHPAIESMCDCSGFVSWCVGIDRYQPRVPLYTRYNGGWVSTDAIVHDAMRPNALTGFFEHARPPASGDVVVYGDHDGKQGHCGIVVSVPPGDPDETWWSALRVIHCSSGNFRRLGDAIAETPGALFAKRAIFARFYAPAPTSSPIV